METQNIATALNLPELSVGDSLTLGCEAAKITVKRSSRLIEISITGRYVDSQINLYVMLNSKTKGGIYIEQESNLDLSKYERHNIYDLISFNQLVSNVMCIIADDSESIAISLKDE